MNDETFRIVYSKKIDDDLKNKVLDMWDRYAGIREEQAVNRLDQLAVVAINSKNEVAGVTTIYKATFLPTGELYYFFRMFVSPKSRFRFTNTRYNKNHIYDGYSYWTRQALIAHKEDNKPKGVVFVAHNRKLKNPVILCDIAGWNLYGVSEEGYTIGYYNFDGSQMSSNVPVKV